MAGGRVVKVKGQKGHWDNLTTLVDASTQVAINEQEEEDEQEEDAQGTHNEFEQEEDHDDESILIESPIEADENSITTNGNLSNNTPESSSSSSPELPSQEFLTKFKELCGEKQIILVIQKSLTPTDVSNLQSRISMPAGKIKNFSFLTKEEKEMLQAEAMKNKRNRRTVPVTLIHKPIINCQGLDDNGMKETEIKLAQWNMHKDKYKNGKEKKVSMMHALNGKPKARIVEENMLEKGDKVQIWASRKTIDNKLCMALVLLSKKIQTLVIEDV
ncbi:hypothetical protein PIB30_034951 [Stylosanthes scabra]|uniref:Uncharacterized protein n=1 Tax=Stylosanthes scabra TaxID=79078 RepID=A0ABU6XAJ3_9FABA|nr:hypothetical protein [Stylosanthes scabra]